MVGYLYLIGIFYRKKENIKRMGFSWFVERGCGTKLRLYI